MGKGRSGKKPPPAGGQDTPFDNPFARLKGIREDLPPGETPADPTAGEAPGPSSVRPGPPRALVRYERKGRGGKEVTLVEKLALSPAERQAWLKGLKQELGCGGVVEGDVLVLQGDQRARLPALLERRGVGRVTVA